MKVMFFIPTSVIGGAETLIQYLTKAYKSLYPEDELIVATKAPPTGQFYIKLSNHATLTQTATPERLAAEIERIKPDIFQMYHSLEAFKALTLLKKFKPRIVIEQVHGCFKFTNCSVDIPKSRTDHIIAVSEKARQFFLKHKPDWKDDITTITNGIDTELFNAKGRVIVPNKLRIGTISRISDADKKISKMLDAFDKISSYETEFFIIGSGYSESDCKRHASHKSVRLQSKLRWIPHQPDPWNWYKKLDIFVSRCESEGFGNSIAEALLSGCAVVAHYCGGITDHLPVGSYFKSNSQSEFEATLQDAVTNHTKRYNVTRIGHDCAHSDFTAEKMAKGYHDLYTKLLKTNNCKKISKAPIIGIADEKFTGVCRAIESNVDLMFKVGGQKNLLSMLPEIANYNPRAILLGGLFEHLDTFLKQIRYKCICPIYYTLHNTFSFCEFNPAIDGSFLLKQIQLVKSKCIDALLVSKRGMEKTLSKFGVPAYYLPNKIESPSYVFSDYKAPGLNIGIMGTGLPWKNMLAQILAAAQIPGAIVHVNTLMAHRELLQQFSGINLVEHNFLSHIDFLDWIRQMTIISAVSYTETYNYIVAEAMYFGVPAITSPMITLYDDDPLLKKHTTVNAIDDIEEIKARMENTIAMRDSLSKKCLQLFDKIITDQKQFKTLEEIINAERKCENSSSGECK